MNGRGVLAAIGFVSLAASGAAQAAPDWSKVPATTLTIFLPGEASWEWLTNGTEHSGAKGMRKGEACAGCHGTETADMGKKASMGDPRFEPKPQKGKGGSIPVKVQAAHDGADLYLRFEWKPAAAGEKMDEKSVAKVAVMLDAGGVESANLAGCWVTCHSDLRSMSEVNADSPKHPRAKELDIRKDGPTKYLKESRTALENKNKPRGGWDKLKSADEVAALLKTGKFMDIMQFRSGEKPRDGHVLDARRMGEAAGLAEGKETNGVWTVTFKRKLAGSGAGDHALAPGKQYTFSFAIHDQHANLRYHHVSLGYTLGIDAKGDVSAAKQ